MRNDQDGTASPSPATTRKQAILQAETAYLARVKTEARLAACGVYVFGPIKPIIDQTTPTPTPSDPLDKAVEDLGSRVDPFV